MDPNIVPKDLIDHGWWAAAGAACAAAVTGVKWWFHVRRLNNADKIDGGISKSLEFVFKELRAEITALKLEVAALKAENLELRTARYAAAHALLRDEDVN